MNSEVIEWLLASDPSVSFQTKRDILGLPEDDYRADQNKISTEGWGKKLLDLQDNDGRWGGGLYGPKFKSTHYTLMLLRRMELHPNDQTEGGCKQLIKIHAIGDVKNEEVNRDACITGMGLGILAHFKSQENVFEDILDFLEERKLEDGAWNCRHPRVKTSHSSFHTTLSILEGLHILEKNYPKFSGKARKLRSPANEFLLVHELFKSHRTKELAHRQFIDISFPPRWKYNILSAMDYFRSIGLRYNERMQDAIDIIKSKEKNGYWSRGTFMSGKIFFKLGNTRGKSEFNTLRALRVLKAYSD